MSFRKRLSALSGIPESHLPSSYQVIGSIFLSKFLTTPEGSKQQVASAIMQMFPYVSAVCELRSVSGEFRQPYVRLLSGSSTETVHKEHGILYKLDVSKIMFSKGNLFERKRLVSQIRPDERILDMFAGIGYFSLPLSARAKKVVAIEKNPIAFHYFKENIRLNKRQNIEAVNADCTDFQSGDKFDRIVMGYFPGTGAYIQSALRFAKPDTVIHFHNSYEKGSEDWKEHFKLFGNAQLLGKRIVKSLSPKYEHIVLDVRIC